MAKAPDAYAQRLLAERARREAARQALASAPKREPQIGMPSKLGQMVSRQPSPNRVGQVRQAITQGVDYAGNVLMQGRAPEIGGVVRQMVEPLAQFPVTAVTDPLKAANQAQQVLDPAYAMARGLTTTRLGAEAGNPGEMAAGVTEMGLAGLSFIPGGAAAKGARATPPARLPEIPQPRNVLAQAKETAAQPRNVLATAPAMQSTSRGPILNQLAGQPELLGGGLGGALGATQGETAEERARNALLGAAGGAVGGRLASRAAIDRTRMGSNLGNVPKPVQKAQAQGYEGADIGEAQEWVSARSKGLDMSQPARLDRAKAMGFDTGTVLYHGTGKAFSEFNPPAFASGRKRQIYLTDKPEIADIYANSSNYGLRNGGDPMTYPVFAKAEKPLIVSDKGPDGSSGWVADNLASALGVEMPKPGKYGTLYEEAKRQGYDQIQIREMLDIGGPQTQFIPLDPSNIRSVNAAFDPAKSSSANILATPPELGGAFVGGALGATQGETPEERARNALLGAAGGAIGGRLASRAAIDRTRMGSNLGNVPKTQPAPQRLDMSDYARLTRAREMGADVTNWEAALKKRDTAISDAEQRLISASDAADEQFAFVSEQTQAIEDAYRAAVQTATEAAQAAYEQAENAAGAAFDDAIRLNDSEVSQIAAKNRYNQVMAIAEKTRDDVIEKADEKANAAREKALARFEGKAEKLLEKAQKKAEALYEKEIEKADIAYDDDVANMQVTLSNGQMRSVLDADFNPDDFPSSNILAGVGAVGAGAAMMLRDQKKPPGQRPRG